MTVFIVYYTVGDGEFIADKAFMNKQKARNYVDKQNESSEYGWTFDEMEVEE